MEGITKQYMKMLSNCPRRKNSCTIWLFYAGGHVRTYKWQSHFHVKEWKNIWGWLLQEAQWVMQFLFRTKMLTLAIETDEHSTGGSTVPMQDTWKWFSPWNFYDTRKRGHIHCIKQSTFKY